MRCCLNLSVSAVFVVLPGIAVAQVEADEPIKTTLCELVKDPVRFSGKMATMRGRVLIAFEDFELDATRCNVNTIGQVWLEYGKGPKKQPTIWCCGDMVPRDPLAVVQDGEFRRFHHNLTTEKSAKQYKVTATLTGRFDAVRAEPCPGDSRARCCPTGGFGHLGMACARLVIESVSDVVAQPVSGIQTGTHEQPRN